MHFSNTAGPLMGRARDPVKVITACSIHPEPWGLTFKVLVMSCCRIAHMPLMHTHWDILQTCCWALAASDAGRAEGCLVTMYA